MASLISPKPTKTSHTPYSSSSTFPSLTNPSKFILNNGRFNKNTTFKVSCKTNNNDETSQNSIDRRNVLLGLGGLYGGANLLNANEPLAFAAPIQAPDIKNCGPAKVTKPDGSVQLEICCPPEPSKITDYVLPKPSVMRVRPPAHNLSKEYLAKFEKAIALMKALPDDDPRSFKQQAKIHCAYCNGSYEQVGFPDLDLQVHFSYLFFPFHRWYLYFYERILGKLIDDPSFGLPFWNWDNPRGMTMPAIFLDPKSPLFDSKRNQGHLPPEIIDLKYDGEGSSFTNPVDVITNNYIVMYRTMVTNASTGIDFLGQPYVAGGESSPGMGSLENLPHTPVHRWVGDPREENGEDLGNFYSAGNDVMFFSHHANCDRMWAIWQQLGGKRREPDTSDFLDSSFLFYDENAQPVRVKTRDCINNKKMGFEYADVDTPWLKFRPPPRNAKSGIAKKSNAPKVAKALPAVLDKRVQVLVPRPRTSRTTKEKDAEEEILVIEGIEFPVNQYVKFDVFINDEDEAEPSFDKSEYLGSFANLPHRTKGKNQVIVTSQRFGLSEPLEDLKAEDDDSVLVTLVPKTGDVKVGGIKIIFAS